MYIIAFEKSNFTGYLAAELQAAAFPTAPTGLWTESSLIIASYGRRCSYSFMDGTYLLESINFTVGRTGGASSQQGCRGKER